jgi:hypothetical protein
VWSAQCGVTSSTRSNMFDTRHWRLTETKVVLSCWAQKFTIVT